MPLSKIAQKQRTLAMKANDDPEYRFDRLYDLLHWGTWMHQAAQAVLSRPGSRTDGVDGKTRDHFKDHYDSQMAMLIEQLKRDEYQPLPVRRVHIPKSNGKKRPLGIPALRDRIVQEGIRMALDPIYESDFQPYSFGFRKGRCTMDAIAVLMPMANTRMKHYYVIEGDLKSYFDTVNHRILLKLLKKRIADKKLLSLIHRFLKAGVMENQLFAATREGVPQGGIISPLLANVYLNEFDKWAVRKWQLSQYERQKARRSGRGHYIMVRYADDFVVITNDGIKGVRRTKQEIKAFLEGELKLTLSEEKTLITHVNKGYDFLGFNVRRVKPEGRWVVHLRPTQKSVQRVKAKIKSLTTRNQTLYDEITQMTQLNQIVRGWCEYYKHTSLQEDLEAISRYAWHRYHYWLLAKYKGSRKVQLIKDKSRIIMRRQRWVARTEDIELHQWLPSPKELSRSRYPAKGREGFGHPYLADDPEQDTPEAFRGPNPAIYLTVRGGLDGNRKFPDDWHTRRLKVLKRDGFACTVCKDRNDIQVHHKKGLRSWAVKDLVTLCRKHHLIVHGYSAG
ncbi:MAG: group II intron reverse transcriptase/maturase [Sedimenticola sp.]